MTRADVLQYFGTLRLAADYLEVDRSYFSRIDVVPLKMATYIERMTCGGLPVKWRFYDVHEPPKTKEEAWERIERAALACGSRSHSRWQRRVALRTGRLHLLVNNEPPKWRMQS